MAVPGMRLLAHHLDGAEDDAVDVAGGDAGAPQHLVQDGDREVVGAHGAEHAALRVGAAERRADVPDQDGLSELAHGGSAL